jgi:membrane-associated PAP2 superfamily phosphatase
MSDTSCPNRLPTVSTNQTTLLSAQPSGLEVFLPKLNYPALLAVPALLFVFSVIAIELLELDHRLAALLYSWQGDQWLLRNHIVTNQLIHHHGRQLVGILSLIVLALLAGSFIHPALKVGRRVFGYLLLAPLSAALLVNVLKQTTQMDCPYHITDFGGLNAYTTLWQSHSGGHGCFPAGHASAGYCWLALFFAAHYVPADWRAHYPQLPRYGLAVGLSLGLIFGISQQLRGAHFVSHDVWTATLCWLSSTVLAYLLLEKPARLARASMPNNQPQTPSNQHSKAN